MTWVLVAESTPAALNQSPSDFFNIKVIYEGTLVYGQASFMHSSLGEYPVDTPKVARKSGANYKTLVEWDGSGNRVRLYEDYTPPTYPPSAPTSISVPSVVKGGENLSISWGVGTGATSYYLERSVNGGVWAQVYSGGSRSYTDYITKGWLTVSYRVRAYNSDGYSGYTTSPTRTVINNTAPTTPPSITVPELRSGTTATITWGSSSDSDGDTINYYLERSVNGSGYSVIRSGGTSLSFIDTILGQWNTVSYRVRAYDGKDYSGYRTSEIITVSHFPDIQENFNGALTSYIGAYENYFGNWIEIIEVWENVNGTWIKL